MTKSQTLLKNFKGISGGQTGADRTFLDVCIALNIPHGGWCPAGRRAEDGKIPDHYNLKETASGGYKDRTRLNVIEGDATVIFNRHQRISAGCRLTVKYCQEAQRPYLLLACNDVEYDSIILKNWLQSKTPEVLNIAGNREETTPGIGEHVRQVLMKVLPEFIEKKS